MKKHIIRGLPVIYYERAIWYHDNGKWGLRPPAPPPSQLFSLVTNTIEKDMFLFVLAYQNHNSFDLLEQREMCLLQWFLSLRKFAVEGGAGGLKKQITFASLRSNDPKIEFCCTHPRTSREQIYAFLWGVEMHCGGF